MRKPTTLLFSGLTILSFLTLSADESAYFRNSSDDNTNAAVQPAPFSSFTGKVAKNKVRLRLQPNLESPVIKELAQGDMLIIIGETEDFYAAQAPAGLKSYVFRTYILDNVVEASRVNVRLEPDLEAPVIAQLHGGDRIEGTISTQNNKWLEIPPPASARFYVAKEFIENIGDASVLAAIEKQRNDANILLSSTYQASQAEMQKSFPEINLDGIYANLNKIINVYKNFPEQVARAKELISSLQDSYLQKKIAYLEAKTKIVQDDWEMKNSHLNDQMKFQQQKLSNLEQQLKKNSGSIPYSNNGLSNKMAAWLPVEQTLYDGWAKTNDNRSRDEFYRQQNDSAVALRGILEPYNRVIKNKPGDYILVNQSNHLPIAYLYSTQVNLQDKIGQEVTIFGAPRDNHSFAFPAYFVLRIE
jgi:hypothetical protein